jgi:peptidoglycan/LPS O-acetylase OafA/YrhL
MSQWDFYKRRLIRLQPMVIMGTLIGAALFYFQGGAAFSLINGTPVWKMLLIMVIGCTLIPIPTSMDIRGWQEMHPLNGPAWSLFFEYIANILYAVIFRRFSKTLLAIFVLIFAGLLVNYLVFNYPIFNFPLFNHFVWKPQGDVIGGWSLNADQLTVGFTRLLYPFFAGVLLCRLGKLIHIKGAFWVCSALIIIVFSVPRLGGADHLWMNGLYEAFAIIVIFPLIVAIGAGGHIKSARSARICKFLGDISYPLYITHYALIYCYTAWVVDNKIPLGPYGLMWGGLLFIASIVIAYACLKLYDEPVREWLRKRFLVKKA